MRHCDGVGMRRSRVLRLERSDRAIFLSILDSNQAASLFRAGRDPPLSPYGAPHCAETRTHLALPSLSETRFGA
jgi:hypothetical protein